jgi:hypothetical protein
MKAIQKIQFITILLLGLISSWAQTAAQTPTTVSLGLTASSTVGAAAGVWKQKWEQMTPAQKEAFLQTHPKSRERVQQQRYEDKHG